MLLSEHGSNQSINQKNMVRICRYVKPQPLAWVKLPSSFLARAENQIKITTQDGRIIVG